MTKTCLFAASPLVLAPGLMMLSSLPLRAQEPPARAPAPRTAPAKVEPDMSSPFAAFRLGVVVSPVASVDGGLDVTFPRAGFSRGLATRIDLDLTAHFNSRSFGSRRDGEAALSICQIYTPGGINRGRYFLGAGLGGSLGPRSGLLGKLIGGVNLTRVVSVEAEAQFGPTAGPRAVLMLRLSAL